MATADSSWLIVGASRNLPTRPDRNLLIFILQLIELVINAVLGEQLLVGTHFAHLSLVHDDNFVGALDSRKAVGDDHRRAALDHKVERVAHPHLSLRVHARSS